MPELAAWESFGVIVGSAALLLLFIGIHNAWDAVIYHVLVRGASAGKGPQ
jgi:hypothetical protein